MSLLIVIGDIGGTNTRLRLVSDDALHQLIYEHTYRGAVLLRGFEWIVQDFLSRASEALGASNYERPTTAYFAVAGPVVLNDDGSATAVLTNLSWILNDRNLEIALEIEHVTLINDFTAVCHGILQIRPSDYDDSLVHHPIKNIETIQPGKYARSSPIAVIGAGTGLGQGFIIPNGDNRQIFPSEGGHSDFAPNSKLEIKILQHLKKKRKFDHVSAERLISGQGIVAIYKFLRKRKKFAESSISALNQGIVQEIRDLRTWDPNSDEDFPDPSALISRAAHQKDPLSVATMDLFVRAYAAEARNLALKLLPYGGLYIAGGIVTKNMPFFTDKQRFRRAFIQGGRMSNLLKDIPVHIVTTEEIGLIGAIHASQ
jgi:glucokinase